MRVRGISSSIRNSSSSTLRVVVVDTAAVVATATATTTAIEVNLHTVSKAIIIAATISVRWGVGHNMLFWCFLILPFYDNFIALSIHEWLHLTS